jgi:NADH-quinone oxidoreductase subunit A
LAIGLLIVSGLLNPGKPSNVTRMPYESGMDPIHDTHRRFDVRFHLLAIAFLIFDVELLFLYPWAVAVGNERFRAEGRGRNGAVAGIEQPSASESPMGDLKSEISHPPFAISNPSFSLFRQNKHLVFVGAMTFLLLLTLGFVYDWRKGIFRWR